MQYINDLPEKDSPLVFGLHAMASPSSILTMTPGASSSWRHRQLPRTHTLRMIFRDASVVAGHDMRVETITERNAVGQSRSQFGHHQQGAPSVLDIVSILGALYPSLQNGRRHLRRPVVEILQRRCFGAVSGLDDKDSHGKVTGDFELPCLSVYFHSPVNQRKCFRGTVLSQ